jgi:hypothetical protein
MKTFTQMGTTHEWIWTEADDGSLSIKAGCFKGTLPDLIKEIGINKVMERFNLICEALKMLSRKERVQLVGSGSGGGNGSGCGYGNGSGNGSGGNSGYGYGYGSGSGSGYGSGSGSGSGIGYGNGSGGNSGYGYGYGNGSGYGYGSGSGYSNGSYINDSNVSSRIVIT